MIKKVAKLVCNTCGKKMGVPSCCGMSMMFKNDYLLCCCSDDCDHKPIPECCGKKMELIE